MNPPDPQPSTAGDPRRCSAVVDERAVDVDESAVSVDESAVSIVPISHAQGRAPLFFFTNPPTAATVAAGLSRPVYAVPPIGIETATRLVDTATRAGEILGPALARCQPDGPLYLLGHCSHGIMALEAAQWLNRNGRQVRFLGLVDTVHPGLFARRLPSLASVIDRTLHAHPAVAAAAAALDERWQHRDLTATAVLAELRPALRTAVFAGLDSAGLVAPQLREELLAGREAFLHLTLTAWRHLPTPYPGPLGYVYNTVGLNTAGLGLRSLLASVDRWRDTAGPGFEAVVVDAAGMADPHDDLPGHPDVLGYLARRAC
ncbi:thioesterase domain-containing protein [Plantactinospora sp. WMMB782]|uniref:thioesterase domain-containing protein n=1 Tax=Plantactinospora sp. WMMB782 TaxID=3404121 RepID=UPI003B954DAD